MCLFTKKMSLLFLALIFTLLSAIPSDGHLVDFRLTLAAEKVKNCTEPGNLCETCSNLVFCVLDGDVWIKKPLEPCKSPKYCVNGDCTLDGYPFCDGSADLPFPCTTTGAFPHPFYCDKYVLCVLEAGKPKGYPIDCPDGWGFNEKNDLCDRALSGGECPAEEYPVPLCKAVGQSKAIADKPAMYYLCEQYSSSKPVLYPFLYLCSPGKIYSGNICQETTTTSVTTPTTPTTPVTPTTKSTLTPAAPI